MSLNYDLRKIPEDVKTVTLEHDDPANGRKAGDKVMSPVTNALIWSTMSIGIGDITAKNAEEVFGRISFVENLLGAFIRYSDRDQKITLKNVTDHIGLSTNVFPKETQAAWLKRMMEAHMRETVQRHKRLAEQENKSA